MKKIVVLTGAGISQESGIETFRDADGLWEGHDVMEVATPQGFERNPKLVLEFYNQRRRQLKTVKPNDAHLSIAELENEYEVQVITQNVDNLHERAGSTNVLHLHGELFKVKPVGSETPIMDWEGDLNVGDCTAEGVQLRPHVVWFGEEVPNISQASTIMTTADVVLVVGTSFQVYPAAGLVEYAPNGVPIVVIDPNPKITNPNVTVIAKKATEGMKDFQTMLTNNSFK